MTYLIYVWWPASNAKEFYSRRQGAQAVLLFHAALLIHIGNEIIIINISVIIENRVFSFFLGNQKII